MESAAGTTLELGRPFPKEFNRAVNELREPIRELTQKAEKLKQEEKSAKPAQVLREFISQNREKILQTQELIRKFGQEDKGLTKQAVQNILIEQISIPFEVVGIVSENLVEASLTTSSFKALRLLKNTLEFTNFSQKDRENFTNLAEDVGRELVPVEPVIEAEVEYTPPAGPPGGPPGGRRGGWFGFGGGGREERTAEEARGRRRRLPQIAAGVGGVILALSTITGGGKPWEGQPIGAIWWTATRPLVGVGVGSREGIEKIVEAELGPSKDWARNKVHEQLLNQKDQGFNSGVGNIVISMIEDELGVKEPPKNRNIIFNPETQNEGTREYVEALDSLRKELKIEVNDFAEELQKRGHTDKEGAELLEIFLESGVTGKPIEEIEPGSEKRTIDYYEAKKGHPWPTRSY